jgi:3-dehydroquinate dehydratase II
MSINADITNDKVAWTRALGGGLRTRRKGNAPWRLHLIDGPNMSNLGEGGRDPRTYGAIRSIGELQQLTAALAEGLGVAMQTYQSNYEGDIVQYIYDSAAEVDAYLINPAALTRRGAPCALALIDSRRPYVELHFANIAALGWSNGALITRRASGVVMGLRHYSYVGAVFGLVGALDAGVFGEMSHGSRAFE